MRDGTRVWRFSDVKAAARCWFGRPPGADRQVSVNREERGAEWRWHYNNLEKKTAGCFCGGPSQVIHELHEVEGTIPARWWTCWDHRGSSAPSGDVELHESQTE